MAIYGALATPTSGMKSMAHAMNTIGLNVANIGTGGYKEVESRFKTVLSESLFQQSDLGGVKPLDTYNIDKQGLISSSESDYDVSINGHGFFTLSTAQTGGETLYGRDGSFNMRTGASVNVLADDGVTTISVREGFLADKNGHYVMGVAPDPVTGLFPATPTTLQALRIDPYAFRGNYAATTTAQLTLNLPALDTIGQAEKYVTELVSSNGTKKSAQINFTKTSNNNWNVTVSSANALDTVTSTSAAITFNANGTLPAATPPYTVAVTWADGSTSSVALDLDQMVQFAGDFNVQSYSRNGYPTADMSSFSFDSNGYVVGHFADATTRTIYRVPVSVFSNPNGLEIRNGNVYGQSTESGVPLLSFPGNGYATFSPNSRELSNVDLQDQFSRMIMTQTAYNASSTTFKTIDEMMVAAKDLKR